jgi:hypothetical protein
MIAHRIFTLLAAIAMTCAYALAQNPVIGVVDLQMKPNQTLVFIIHNGITLYTVGKVPDNLRVRVINASKKDLLRLPGDRDGCVTLATNLIVTGFGYPGSLQLNPIDNEAFLPGGMGANAKRTLTLVFEALDTPEPGVIRIKKKFLSAYLSHAVEITLTGTSPASILTGQGSPPSFFASPVTPPSADCYVVQIVDNVPLDGFRDFTLVALATPAACEESSIALVTGLQAQQPKRALDNGRVDVDR